MVEIENLTTEAAEICIIHPCEGNGNPNIPSETHWRCGLLNSPAGRERLLEILADYPESIKEVLATWGDKPTETDD